MALRAKPQPGYPQRQLWRGVSAPITRYGGDYWKSRNTLDLIWSSIVLILGTPIGTRIMLPNFGSRLAELVFEQNDEVLVALANRYIMDAISHWEPRVNVQEVDTSIDEHEFNVRLQIVVSSIQGVQERLYTIYRNQSLKIVQQFYNDVN